MGKTKIIFEVIFQNYHPMALYEAVFKKASSPWIHCLKSSPCKG